MTTIVNGIDLQERVRLLEYALRDTIRVIRMVEGLSAFAHDEKRSDAVNEDRFRMRTSLGLYARQGELILGEKVPR